MKVSLRITRCTPDDLPESDFARCYRRIEVVIAGESVLETIAHYTDEAKACADMLASADFFLAGHHHPSHYTGKFAHLAATAH